MVIDSTYNLEAGWTMKKMRQIQPEYIMPTNIDGNTEKK
jgi:hypothetical protein